MIFVLVFVVGGMGALWISGRYIDPKNMVLRYRLMSMGSGILSLSILLYLLEAKTIRSAIVLGIGLVVSILFAVGCSECAAVEKRKRDEHA